MIYVLLIVLAGAGLAVYVTWLASRLRRLHARVQSAAEALNVRLIRRATTAMSIATARADALGGAEVALELAAHAALHMPQADREAAQSDLTGAIQQAIYDAPAPRVREIFADIIIENRRVEMARALYNDAVRDTAGLRRKRFPRAFRLAANVPAPAFFDINTSITLPTRAPARSGAGPAV